MGGRSMLWRRVNGGVLLNHCKNKALCTEKLGEAFTCPPCSSTLCSKAVWSVYCYRQLQLLNRGSPKALDKVVELETWQEMLIIKTTIHDIMSQMIREIPIRNPVYLMLGASFGSAPKGTWLRALEFALSACDSVDMYGFTLDPGYKEWTRYLSESQKGHMPLLGRAYYQMMECLGEGWNRI